MAYLNKREFSGDAGMRWGQYSVARTDEQEAPGGSEIRNECDAWLVEQIFPPTIVAAAQHAHDLATGVKREGAWLAHQSHVVDFVEQAVAFATIAGVAAGNEIFPSGVTATGTRHHVVQRQLCGGKNDAAILAGVAIAQQDVFAGEGARLVGDAPVLQQTDHRGHGDAAALRVQHKAMLFLGARDAFENEHQGAPRAANIDGLVRGIQHEHRHLENLA